LHVDKYISFDIIMLKIYKIRPLIKVRVLYIIFLNNINLYILYVVNQGIISMKYLFLFLITLSVSIKTYATDERACKTPSEAGSYLSVTSGILSKHVSYDLPSIDNLNFDELIIEFNKLSKSYHNLLQAVNASEEQLNRFVISIDGLLPGGINRVEANQDSLVTLKSAFRQLVHMYKKIREGSKSASTKVTELESTLALNSQQMEALHETLGLLRKSLGLNDTTFSPPRLARLIEVASKTTDELNTVREELSVLKAENASLRSQQAAGELLAEEKSKKIAALNAENERLKAENAALKRAQQAADTAASRASSSDVTTPLLSKDKKNGQGCPCTIS
jgi:hypothetical protein